MAEIKISELTSGSALDGTEVVPIVQSGATVKVTTQDIADLGGGLTIGSTPIASGTVGRVLFEGTGNVLQQSSSLFWENTTGRLELTTSADNQVGLLLKSTTGILKVRTYLNGTYGTLIQARDLADSAYNPMSLSGSKLMLLDGNVLINTVSDAGYKLDVNGTARVTNLTVNNSILGQGSTQSLVFNNGTGITTLSDNVGIQLNLNNNQTFFSFRSSSSGGSNRYLMITNTQGSLPTHPNACAVLQLYSTNTGFLPPRMTTTQKNAISTPANGLQVFDTTLNQMSYYNGTTWINL